VSHSYKWDCLIMTHTSHPWPQFFPYLNLFKRLYSKGGLKCLLLLSHSIPRPGNKSPASVKKQQ
jgi:hypothetical protein